MSKNSEQIFHFQCWGIRWVRPSCLSLLRIIFLVGGGRWLPCSQLSGHIPLRMVVSVSPESYLLATAIVWRWGTYPIWPITRPTCWPLWSIRLETKTPTWAWISDSFSPTLRQYLNSFSLSFLRHQFLFSPLCWIFPIGKQTSTIKKKKWPVDLNFLSKYEPILFFSLQKNCLKAFVYIYYP